jgi:hypothetical protein
VRLPEKAGISKKNYTFAECLSHGTRQINLFTECHFTSTRQRAYALPSVTTLALGKEHMPSVDLGHSAQCMLFAECHYTTTRQRAYALPSATLGKGFAECLYCFAECVRHSANEASPVVVRLELLLGPQGSYATCHGMF